ncbi:acid phosphatase type 7 [Aplysia californica]|uniref:Purple acid phosphatase n=1 Tax=Aplysia californica TaxID=6500 RepID=A0ABM0K4C7_APLCA|nr:acid phosphatase type 7 [Aplysia californica]
MEVNLFRWSFLSLTLLFGACLGTVWHQPQQTHIAAGDTPDKIIIVWSTFNKTGDTTVLYGKNGKPTQKATGSVTTFTDQGPEKRIQYIHRVILTGLEPKTDYTYMVGSEAYGFSDIFVFRTWPAGENWSPSLAIFGDLGNENAQSLPRLEVDAAAGMYDAILHVGDFAYDLDVDNARVGDEFMRQIEPLASRLPYMTCPGNHENAHNFSNYRNRFWMPGDENKRTYFSFNMGPVHFISLSTELLFYVQYGLVPIVEQYKWLERDLAEANKPENRQKRPWIIVFGHRPMYCSNDDNDDCTHHESLVRVGIPFLHILGMEKLLHEYGVDIALWAHEHSYERLWPVYNRKVYNGSYSKPYTNPGAPVHITTGSAGCKEKHDNFDKKVDDWSAFRSDDYGYTRMKVYNSTHVYMEQVSDDKHGAIIDKLMVVKEKHGPYPHDPRPVVPVADPMKKLWKHFKDFVDVENLP